MARHPSIIASGSQPRPTNRLLAALPPEDFSRLAADMTTIQIRRQQVLQKQGEPPGYVYFLNGGVCSITTVMSDGTMVEAVSVGEEGMVGLEASALRGAMAPGEAIMHVSDTSAERLDVDAYRRELANHSALAVLMNEYTLALIAEIMQLAACNIVHGVEERCCRWLLMTHDRMHHGDFQLSHELLAMMLGVRRQTITVAARTLQSAGLIAYTRGHVRILDRKGLEGASCECYAIVRGHTDRLRV
jgi:CRP-like cAMP-binding protein